GERADGPAPDVLSAPGARPGRTVAGSIDGVDRGVRAAALADPERRGRTATADRPGPRRPRSALPLPARMAAADAPGPGPGRRPGVRLRPGRDPSRRRTGEGDRRAAPAGRRGMARAGRPRCCAADV